MKDKELIKQQKIWYKKLKEEGFRDIEYYDGDMEPRDIMANEGTKFHNSHTIPEVSYYPKEHYYILAGRFLHDHQFETDLYKQMWAAHAAGDSYLTIASNLGSTKVTVMRRIIILRKIMLDLHILTPQTDQV